MNYRQLRDELLTLSDEQLELTITVLNRDSEYFASTIGGLYYSTEEDDYNEVLIAGHPYLMVWMYKQIRVKMTRFYDIL